MPRLKEDAEQTYIPGIDPPSIPEIDKAARKFVAVHEERKRLAADEEEARDALIEVMERHELRDYKTRSGMRVSLSGLTKVKVSTNGEE